MSTPEKAAEEATPASQPSSTLAEGPNAEGEPEEAGPVSSTGDLEMESSLKEMEQIEIGQPIPYEDDSGEAHIVPPKMEDVEEEDQKIEFPRIEGWMLKEKQGKTAILTMGLVTR